jgi:glycosyltransferase involved in cell wall biosynthesis
MVQQTDKHIVIDNRESGTSTGRYSDKLVEYLAKLHASGKTEGLRFTILTKAHRMDYIKRIAPDFACLESPYKEFTFQEQGPLREQIERLKPDLVHFCMVQQPVWYGGLHVTTMHDLTTTRFRNPAKNSLVFTFKQQVYKWVNKRAARRSRFVFTPSEFVKKDVVDFAGISPDKVVVTYESSDDLPTPALAVPSLEGKQFIVYLGRPTPHKNLEGLVKAFKILQADRPDLLLALAGKTDANYQRVGDWAKEQGIGNIVFTGFLEDTQLRWLFENCQAYVFPSFSEGFGLPGLEAMRHGAPVASSNATCLPEVYGEAAYYFDPQDAQDMATKINTLITDQTLRQNYIARGYEQAKKYSWQRMAEQTLDTYRKALGDD